MVLAVAKILHTAAIKRIPDWDEAVYLCMGKWLAGFGSMGLWESYRPPGLPLVLGILYNPLMSPEAYIAVADLVMLLFTVGCLIALFLLAREIFGAHIAGLSCAILAASPLFFHASLTIMTGLPAVFFVLLSLYMLLRNRLFLAGLFAGVATIFRFPAGLVFAAIMSYIIMSYIIYTAMERDQEAQGAQGLLSKLMQHRTKFALILTGFFFPALAYLGLSTVFHSGPFQPLLLAAEHISVPARNLIGVFGTLLYYPYTLIAANIVLALAIPGLIRPDRKAMAALVPLIIFLVFFSAIPHKVPRFGLLVLPFAAMFAARGFFLLKDKLTGHRIPAAVPWAGIALMFLWPLGYDLQIYNSADAAEPGTTEYYRHFSERQGLDILTTDPVPCVYSNNRHIHMYDSPEYALETYTAGSEGAHALIYNKDFYPCDSKECNSTLQELDKRIRSEWAPALQTDLHGTAYTIFTRK